MTILKSLKLENTIWKMAFFQVLYFFVLKGFNSQFGSDQCEEM